MSVLDVGAGPGTITLDLARRVAPGRVRGIDPASDVIGQADAARIAAGIDNADFADDPDGWLLMPHAEILARR